MSNCDNKWVFCLLPFHPVSLGPATLLFQTSWLVSQSIFFVSYDFMICINWTFYAPALPESRHHLCLSFLCTYSLTVRRDSVPQLQKDSILTVSQSLQRTPWESSGQVLQPVACRWPGQWKPPILGGSIMRRFRIILAASQASLVEGMWMEDHPFAPEPGYSSMNSQRYM